MLAIYLLNSDNIKQMLGGKEKIINNHHTDNPLKIPYDFCSNKCQFRWIKYPPPIEYVEFQKKGFRFYKDKEGYFKYYNNKQGVTFILLVKKIKPWWKKLFRIE